jgi:hypothetical protein
LIVDKILFNDTLAAEGAIVFAKACEMGLEGIVSKRVGSRSRPRSNPEFARAREAVFPACATRFERQSLSQFVGIES